MTILEAKGISRYYYFNGNAIKNIVFYNDDGIITMTNQGWLEYYGDLRQIECGEIVNRNKENLTRKENFVIKSTVKHWSNDKAELILYLYVDNCNIKIKKTKEEVKTYGSDYNLSYCHNYYDTFEGMIDGQPFKIKVLTKYENIDIMEKKQALKIYESIKKDCYFIDEAQFLKLYNLCKITKRTEKLIKD